MTTGASPNSPYPGNAGWAGPAWFLTGGSAFNAISFVAQQIIAGRTHAAIVQVKSCTNSGGLSPVGTVSVSPLVGQVDGFGNVVPHGTIYNVPYLRLQGGSSAVILDPAVGDIGLAVMCDRDSSVVKVTRAPSAPGSFRQNDWADGMYLGVFISPTTPSQYVQFSGSGVTISSNNPVTIQSNGNTVVASASGVTVTSASGASVTVGGASGGVTINGSPVIINGVSWGF